MLKVTEVDDVKTFINFPFELYKESPHYVSDLKINIKKLLTKDPFWLNNSRALFVAYEGKRPVGRICALTNTSHNNHWQDRTGFFGFFDCVNDNRVAAALFETAGKWLKARGFDKMRGPMNPSTNHTCGVLVDNFDKDPYIMMPYNFAYYDGLIKSCGLLKVKDLLAFERSDKDDMSERMKKIISRIMRNKAIKIRQIDMSDFDGEVDRVCKIYNASWSQNWGFVPISDAEILQTAKELKPIVKPEVTAMCEVDGELAAFAIAIPNMNRVLKCLKGGFGLTKLYQAWRAYKNISDCRMIMLGVHPNHRGRGLELLVVKEVVEKGVAAGWNHAELSWLLEDNNLIISVVEETGCHKTKTYRIYERSI